jgi:hypothetical protein
VQQRLPAGQQHHEQAGLLVAGQVLEGSASLAGTFRLKARAVVLLAGAGWSVHRSSTGSSSPRCSSSNRAGGRFAVGQPLALPVP